MSKRLIIMSLGLSFLVVGCNSTNDCENGVLDGSETEIDCGGDCEPCPADPTLTATVEGVPYVATQFTAGVSGNNAINIGSSGTAGTHVNFTFSGSGLNTYLPITGGTYYNNIQGFSYHFVFGDTGSVYLTSHDELRKIISGHFWYNATGFGASGSINDGHFENVRY